MPEKAEVEGMLGECILKRIGGQIRHQRLQKNESRGGGTSRILLLTQPPLVFCKFNQFPCSLEANIDARNGGGQGDVGGGHNKEDRRLEKDQRLHKKEYQGGGPYKILLLTHPPLLLQPLWPHPAF